MIFYYFGELILVYWFFQVIVKSNFDAFLFLVTIGTAGHDVAGVDVVRFKYLNNLEAGLVPIHFGH